MNTAGLKKTLLEKAIEIQEKRVQISRNAMMTAQESANEEKGTMGDKYESFREQMQIDRDMYAKQFDESMQVLNALKRIEPEKQNDTISPGTLVITDSQNFYISASLGLMEVENEKFMAVSLQSPICNAMKGKKPGESFQFRDKKFKIEKII